MNGRQKIVLLAASALFALVLLCPPRHYATGVTARAFVGYVPISVVYRDKPELTVDWSQFEPVPAGDKSKFKPAPTGGDIFDRLSYDNEYPVLASSVDSLHLLVTLVGISGIAGALFLVFKD